ncbi:TlpA family protein disulfide reductase [bacterium]|nr:TlpA family protein disulfide reductase [bacterium]
MKTRRYLHMVIALVLISLAACAANAQISTGTKAPDFTLPTLDGGKFTLSDCFKEQPSVVVLDIWATWCPPCKAEIPYLVDLQNKYQSNKSVTIVGVAFDQDKTKVADFARSQSINYTVVLDYGGNKIGSSYKVGGIPMTCLIDKKGIIRYVHNGFPIRDENEQKKEIAKMEGEIKTLLDEK